MVSQISTRTRNVKHESITSFLPRNLEMDVTNSLMTSVLSVESSHTWFPQILPPETLILSMASQSKELILMRDVTWALQMGTEVVNSLGTLYVICKTKTTPSPPHTLKMSHAVNIEPIVKKEVTGIYSSMQ